MGGGAGRALGRASARWSRAARARAPRSLLRRPARPRRANGRRAPSDRARGSRPGRSRDRERPRGGDGVPRHRLGGCRRAAQPGVLGAGARLLPPGPSRGGSRRQHHGEHARPRGGGETRAQGHRPRRRSRSARRHVHAVRCRRRRAPGPRGGRGRHRAAAPHVRQRPPAEARAADTRPALRLRTERRDTLQLGPDDRCLNVMPLFHIHGLVAALLASLEAGASVVCTPGFHQVRFFDWLDEPEPTWYTAVPTMHAAVLARSFESADNPSRAIACASSARRRPPCPYPCSKGSRRRSACR